MKIRHVNNQADFVVEDYSNYYAVAQKPFKCTCLCLERPSIVIKNNNYYFGKIIEPFSCCDSIYDIYDSSDKTKWKISGNCCQCGLLFKNTICGKCAEVTFHIFSANDSSLDSSNSKGYIKKQCSGIQELVSDADNFELVFPKDATPEEKMMLIGTVLMIDYRHFEDNGTDKRKQTTFDF
jgi:hypothetical protein